MEKDCLISVCIISLTLASALPQVVNGQNRLVWEEVPGDTIEISDEIPEGKALFIFDAEEGFNFESDATLIEKLERDGSLYKFLVDIEPSSGGVTIKHKGIYSNNYIPWGKENLISLPSLKNKEVKFFNLALYTTLDCSEITSETIKRGSTYTQARYEKEALIILNVTPADLDLIISGSEITDIVSEEGLYKVYIRPVGQQILLKSNNYDDYIIEFDDGQLQTKDVRYYRVQPPPSTKVTETFDFNVKKGSYTIESMPVGALIQIIGNKEFNEKQFRTPYTLENYKEGNEIITLTLNRFETILDTILISSTTGKKSNYNLIPDFAFINFSLVPAIPISKVLMDGKELSMVENGTDYECPKGFHVIEIDAPGYFSEIRQVSFVAGKTHEMDVSLKPNTSSSTNSFSNGQNVGAEYQSGDAGYQPSSAEYKPGSAVYRPNVARYQPAPTSRYYRSTSTVNQRTPAAFNQNARAVGYSRSTSTTNQRTPAVGYQKSPATFNYSAPPAEYNRTPATMNQRTPSSEYRSTPTTVNQRTPSTGYNRTITTVNQKTPSAGYQQAPADVNRSTPTEGYNRRTTTVNTQAPSTGYKRTTTTVNKGTPATGYKRTTTTVNKRTPYVPPKKYNAK